MSKMKQIAIDVAVANSLTLDEIKSRNRTASFSHPRQEAMRQQRAQGYSLTQIGMFWGRDHTTILHGVRAAEARA